MEEPKTGVPICTYVYSQPRTSVMSIKIRSSHELGYLLYSLWTRSANHGYSICLTYTVIREGSVEKEAPGSATCSRIFTG